MQVGEIIRDLDLEGQEKKKGTPTMGGVIIILAIIVPCLLVGNLASSYMLLMLGATLWLGAIGFLDDYKKFRKHNKDGIQQRQHECGAGAECEVVHQSGAGQPCVLKFLKEVV